MTTERITKLWDEEESLQRKLVTVKRLIQIEEQIILQELILKVIQNEKEKR